MPVLSLACHLPHNTPNIPSRYNNEQTTKQTKAINNSYIYISHVNVTQTVPDISPLMPMHQDPLLVLYYVLSCHIEYRVMSCHCIIQSQCILAFHLSISVRVASLALRRPYGCPGTNDFTLNYTHVKTWLALNHNKNNKARMHCISTY